MFGRAVYEDANNATAPLANREAGQEPFARSEDAFRFGKLQQQQRGPNYNGSSKYAVFSFGIPTHVSPASVAAHFPNTASHFPSSQLINTKVPIDREEATRFDVLRARRAAIAPYDNARQEAANFRRMDYVRRDIMNQQRAELKRHEKINAARERKGHPESVNNFNIPTHVSLATVASHFPYAASHFPRGGQSKVPIAFEQAHRFDGLAARREALANRERERFDGAAERREAILVHRQSILEDKDRMRQEGVERAKARRAKLFADAMVAQKQMQGQQLLRQAQDRQRKAYGTGSNSSTAFAVQIKGWFRQLLNPKPLIGRNSANPSTNDCFPFSYELTMVRPSQITAATRETRRRDRIAECRKLMLIVSETPKTVPIGSIKEHFPHTAPTVDPIPDDHNTCNFAMGQEISIRDEEILRFIGLGVRREIVFMRDQERQNINVKRRDENIMLRQLKARTANILREMKIQCVRAEKEVQLRKNELLISSLQRLAAEGRRLFLSRRVQRLKQKAVNSICQQVKSNKMCEMEEERIKQKRRMNDVNGRRNLFLSTRVAQLKESFLRRSTKAKEKRSNLAKEQQHQFDSHAPKKASSMSLSQPSHPGKFSTHKAFLNKMNTIPVLISKSFVTISRVVASSQRASTEISRFSSLTEIMERECASLRGQIQNSEHSLRENLYEAFGISSNDIRYRETEFFCARKRLFEEKANGLISLQKQHLADQKSLILQRSSMQLEESKKRDELVIISERSEFRNLLKDEQFEKRLIISRAAQKEKEVKTLQAKLYAVNKEIEITTMQLKEKLDSRSFMVPTPPESQITTESLEEHGEEGSVTNHRTQPTVEPRDMRATSIRITTTLGGYQTPQITTTAPESNGLQADSESPHTVVHVLKVSDAMMNAPSSRTLDTLSSKPLANTSCTNPHATSSSICINNPTTDIPLPNPRTSQTDRVQFYDTDSTEKAQHQAQSTNNATPSIEAAPPQQPTEIGTHPKQKKAKSRKFCF